MAKNIYSDYVNMVESGDQSLVDSTSLIEMTPEEVMLENDKRPYNYSTQYEQLQSLRIKADQALGVSEAETLVKIAELEKNGWKYHDEPSGITDNPYQPSSDQDLFDQQQWISFDKDHADKSFQ